MVEKGLSSERKACRSLRISRGRLRYKPRETEERRELIERIRALAAKRPRYGYRRIRALLRRDGVEISRGRMERIWKSDGLALRRKRPRRPKRFPRECPVRRAERRNQVWTYDFFEERTARGNKLRVLAVVDEYTRECHWLEAASSFPAPRVMRAMEWVFLIHGAPDWIRSDNGPEWTAKALRNWLAEQQCKTLYIHPGSPWENGYIESFIGKTRDECLNREVILNRKEAQQLLDGWREEYNERRPHSSLDYRTPKEFAERLGNPGASAGPDGKSAGFSTSPLDKPPVCPQPLEETSALVSSQDSQA